MRGVERGGGIVGEHLVLRHQHRHRRLGMADEQAVVADAQADQNVEIGAAGVQQPRLEDRIAAALRAAGFTFIASGTPIAVLSTAPTLHSTA